MNTSMQPGRNAASSWRGLLRPLPGTRAFCGWTLLLLLGWGSAVPASADGGEISTAVPGPIYVRAGETLTIVTGGSVTVPSGTSNAGVVVESGGTLNTSGGSVSGTWGVVVYSGGTATIAGGSVNGAVYGVQVSGGTLNITGGSVNGVGVGTGVYVDGGGTATISDGSVSGGSIGVIVQSGGTATIFGGSVNATASSSYGVFNYGTLSISGGSASGARAGVGVGSGGTLNMIGGSASGGANGVEVDGTVTISGGTVSGGSSGVYVFSTGTATISGGSVGEAGGVLAPVGVRVDGGTATISGGLVKGSLRGVEISSGTATISGCNLHLVGDQLIGTLQDGSLINTPTLGVGPQNLANQNTGAPQITCPQDVVTPAALNACSASLNLSPPTASDGCSTPPVVVGVRSDGLLLSDPYPVGSTVTITWTATNVGGSNSCSQTVTVTDMQNPTISAPAAVTVNTNSGACTASNISLGDASANDNCRGVTVTNDAPATFPKGPTTVTWRATDAAGNTATATQTVTVNDMEQPTITCPSNITVPATSPSGAPVSFTVGASDNCGSVGTVCTIGDVVITSPHTFPAGDTTVNCTATDAAGNTTTCSFTVTVTPASADLSVTASADLNPVATGSNLTYTITVHNAGPQPAQGVVLTDPLPAGTSFVSATASLGSYTVSKGSSKTLTWSVGTLASGGSATLTLVVKVSAKAGATLSNTATVSSSSPPDPNPSNNSAPVSTTVKARR